MTPRAILFDLDGTLVDSAPDLGGAANEMRRRRGLDVLPLTDYRPHCGSGARGMLSVAFGLAPGSSDYDERSQEFLLTYQARLLSLSALFEATRPTLNALSDAGVGWGIVTNKSLALAKPLCDGLDLHPAVLVGGDCTPHRKPHPAPLLEAARRLELPPESCLYVGDDPRDVIAGRQAGMKTVAARWGYLGPGAAPEDWGADHQLERIADLLKLLRLP